MHIELQEENSKLIIIVLINLCTRSSDEGDDGNNSDDNMNVPGDDEPLTSEEELSDVEEANVVNVAQNQRTYHRRKNLYDVRSIETSFDENNYDVLDLDNEDIHEIVVPLEKRGKRGNKTNYLDQWPASSEYETRWTEHPNPPGVKPKFTDATDIYDCWSIYIDDNILQIIVTYTNQSIRESITLSKQAPSEKICHRRHETNIERNEIIYWSLVYSWAVDIPWHYHCIFSRMGK